MINKALLLCVVILTACGGSDGGNYLELDGVRHDLARASATLIGARWVVRVATTTADACPTDDPSCFTVNLGFTTTGEQTCSSAVDSASIGLTRAGKSYTAAFGGACTMSVDALGEIGGTVTVSAIDATVHDNGTMRVHITGQVSAIRE